MSKRLSRLTLILVTAAGLAASTGSASASPSDNALGQRGENAPGGATTQVDEIRPAGVGQGRKVG